MTKTNVTMKKLLAGLGIATMMLTVPVTNVNATSEIPINAKTFPDKIFRDEYVSKYFDKDKNGKLSEQEIEEITDIAISPGIWDPGFFEKIKDLTGIEYFTKLTSITINDTCLTKLDVSKNTALTELNLAGNYLTKLDVSKNKKLGSLDCSYNELTKLDVSKNKKLGSLDCTNNKLTKLDVSKNKKLGSLDCSYNKLKKLDVSKNTALESLRCCFNGLTTLDLRSNTNLSHLDCAYNKLTTLDLRSNTNLLYLDCCGMRFEKLLDLRKNCNLEYANVGEWIDARTYWPDVEDTNYHYHRW